MALVSKIERSSKSRYARHDPVVRTRAYTFSLHGETYVQFDTYGRDSREVEKVSQSIQVTEEGARELLGLLADAFPGLARVS